MIQIPLQDLKKKILEKAKISEKELNAKIKQKMDSLSGLISEEGAAHIIANEYKIVVEAQDQKFKIEHLQVGLKSVEIVAQVQRKYELRTFTKDNEIGKVASLLASDETGFLRIVFWHEKTEIFEKLKEQDIIHITNGYIRDNQGRLELHLNEQSQIHVNPKGIEIKNAKKLGERKETSYQRKKYQNCKKMHIILKYWEQ